MKYRLGSDNDVGKLRCTSTRHFIAVKVTHIVVQKDSYSYFIDYQFLEALSYLVSSFISSNKITDSFK